MRVLCSFDRMFLILWLARDQLVLVFVLRLVSFFSIGGLSVIIDAAEVEDKWSKLGAWFELEFGYPTHNTPISDLSLPS